MEPQVYIGGQALLEGVLMSVGNEIAIAVRKSDRSIHVEEETRSPLTRRSRFLALPLVRGTVVLYDSLRTGYQALNRSAALSEAAGEELTVENVRHTRIHKRCGTSFLLFVMLISIVLFSFFPVRDWAVL